MHSAKPDSLNSEAEMLQLIHELQLQKLKMEIQNEELLRVNEQKFQKQKLIQQLEAHQIELKLQNEELTLAKEQAELAKEKYAALYDLAPSGYFTLSRDGKIIESNLCGSQMLRKARSGLKNTRFDFFVSDDTRPIFSRFLWKVFNSKAKESCELILSEMGNQPIMYAHLNGIINEDGELCMITVEDITEHKLAEAALVESKELYTDLVAYQRTGIYRILVQNQESEKSIAELISMEFVSDRFCELLEIDRDGSLKDKKAKIFEKIHPCDFPGFLKSNEDAQQSQLPYVWEGRLLIEYRIKWIRFESGPRKLENGSTRWTGIAFDITEQKRAEETLRESEQKYRQLYESIMDAVGFVDMSGNIVNSNSSFQKMVGYSMNELLILNYRDITPDKWLDFENDILSNQVLKRGYSDSYEKEYKRKDGSIFPVEIRSFLLKDDNDHPAGIWAITRDISERKRVEAEIKLKNQELYKINAEKDKYFSIIAHDLRSPFSGFLGLTELMAEGLQQMTLEEIQKIALLMRNSATNLFRLLGNLLEWSRMQRGLIPFIPATFLLGPKISEIMVLALEAANKKEIAISIAIPQDLVVYADADMFAGIIRNLLSNAVKFSHKGSSIVISAKSVSNKSTEISIMDLGIGMNKKLISNLFILDMNTNRKGTDGEYSTGLGLIICKDFIERHGGKLWVESEEGKGSTFRFTLPSNQSIS